MNNLASQIFEQVGAGRLDEEVALQLLRTLKQEASGTKDIAIIGLSLKMPGASNIEQFWDNLEQGRDFIGPLPSSRQRDSLAFIRAFTPLSEEEVRFSYGGYMEDVDKFDYGFFNLSPKEAALMDPNQRLFLQTAWEAIEDAGYGGRRIQGSKTGIYLGYADWPVYGQYITKHQPSHIPMASTGNTPSIMVGRIAYLLDLQGPALLVDTACSSSLVAVHLACTAIRNGECDMAIAGGVKVMLMPVDSLFEIGIESSNRKTSAFDDSSDGTVWGEGTVAVLLKPLDQAVRDRDPIHAVIRGSATNQDGMSVGLTAPNAASQEKLLIRAWEDAGIHPETIGYIEAHGTGTKLGDPIEVDGIRRAFRTYTNRRQFCAIGSVKTNIGHLDAASGVAGLAKAIAALKYKKLPSTLHFTKPNRNIPFEHSPLYVNDRLADWETDEGVPRRCGVSSFGFSGTNCHLVLEEAPVRTSEAVHDLTNDDGVDRLLILSAKTKPSLERLILSYVTELPELDGSLEDICYTANTGRGHYGCRLAVIASSKSDLLNKLQSIAEHGLQHIVKKGIYYDEHRIASGRREVRQHMERTSDEWRVLNEAAQELMVQAADSGTLTRSQLEQLAQHIVQGAEVDWERFYEGRNRRKLHLPVYTFDPSRCWIDPSADTYKAWSATEANAAGCSKETSSIPSLSSTHTSMTPTPRLHGKTDGQYTPTEIKLAQLWERLLGVAELNVDDDFFELGGNSILAIRLEVELEQAGLSFSSEQLYQYSTIREAAACLEQHSGEAMPVDVDESVQQVISERLAMTDDAAASEISSSALLVEEANLDSIYDSDTFILPDMEPFNDLYYRNCFYNSFFPVVNHFGGSILPFLLNDVIGFHHSEHTESAGGYELRYQEVQPIETLFSQFHLTVHTGSEFLNIVEEITQRIRQGHPVIVWIDSYYVPFRKDAYQKQHVDHTLLIYGCNEHSKKFHIFEHDRRENLTYKPCLIDYEDLVRACQGFQDHFQQREQRVAYYITEYNHSASQWKPKLAELQQLFANNQLQNRRLLNESMAVLHQFVGWIKAISSSEDLYKQQIEVIVETLNQILNAKQVEGYRLTALYGADAAVVAAHHACVEQWETIRKGSVRFLYVPTYQVDRIEAMHARLERLWEAEQQFLSTFMDQLECTLSPN
ncbi:phosphopantetheine-binding protein [Paenibacillus sp. SC116]|uniref:beta-ketoacyl synthase N-terminal-like domain-containing protein n=1 Tax=Paenibacillus sp. SC116 TaxID=2968986 RepID=UPI00215B5AA5|nr:beta-ketoacyl synthase N-terminal-like domain-containing protein [Paenibacillus sp. SC116]MCR8844347.1 phosphopantetheine-binding protein [Paenibacillus sp. SC116]